MAFCRGMYERRRYNKRKIKTDEYARTKKVFVSVKSLMHFFACLISTTTHDQFFFIYFFFISNMTTVRMKRHMCSAFVSLWWLCCINVLSSPIALTLMVSRKAQSVKPFYSCSSWYECNRSVFRALRKVKIQFAIEWLSKDFPLLNRCIASSGYA